MQIGLALKKIRNSKSMSQQDVRDKCGLMRCYISRVENERSYPNLQTLEKWCAALGVKVSTAICFAEELSEVK